jgi:hypothetical protein
MLFEIAILEHPTKEQEKEGQSAKLVLGPVYAVTKDDRGAAIAAVMDHADKLATVARDRMEVLVRPFAKSM